MKKPRVKGMPHFWMQAVEPHVVLKPRRGPDSTVVKLNRQQVAEMTDWLNKFLEWTDERESKKDNIRAIGG